MTEIELVSAIPVAILATATIAAKTRGARRVVLAVKPLTMAAILAMFLVESAPSTRGAAWCLVGAGLVAATVGDVLLELESDRFVAGLVSFLAAHVCYLAAFATRAATAGELPSAPACGLAIVLIVAYARSMLGSIDEGLGALRTPVRAYVGVIGVMAWMAVAWFLAARSVESALALAGALFFFASDSLLAVDRFRKPIPYAHALVLSTYFVAQFLIAASAR